MGQILLLTVLATGTAVATGIGAIPVILLGPRVEDWRPLLLGVTAGVMSVAAVVGLLMPALDEASVAEVAAGVAVGIAFLALVRSVLNHRAHARADAARRTSLLVFVVLFAHSLPEGLAVGTAFASTVQGLSAFVIVAISIQNVPEGTSVAIPMALAGESGARQFGAAVLSSAPQPVGAVLAYLLVEQVAALLPFSFAFAAGAMLALVVAEILPEALRRGPAQALGGLIPGVAAMLLLSALLGI